MIKRLISILFLTVYAASVVGSTLERAQAWAAEQRPHDAKRNGSQHLARIGEWHRRSPRQAFQTKLLEDGAFVVSPFVQASPPSTESALQHSWVGFTIGRSTQVISSRAPPALFS